MGLAGFFGPQHQRFLLNTSLMDLAPQPPVYHVHGLIRRGTSTVLAADSGTGKSTIAQALAIATAQGGRWLGLDVAQGPVLYLHGEEPLDVTADNLRALGLRSTDSDLRYWRGPIVLSQPEARRAVEEEIAEFGIVLAIFDSAVMLSGGDPNSNLDAASFMGWVGTLDTTTLTVHHEGKGGSDGSGGGRSAARAKKAVLGAMQWTAQCDLLISLELDKPYHVRTESEGEVMHEWRVRAQLPKERRFGAASGMRRITKWSRSRGDVLMEMEIRTTETISSDSSEPNATTQQQQAGQQVYALLKERHRMTRAELGEALPDIPKKTLDRALRDGVVAGMWTKPDTGVYELGEGQGTEGHKSKGCP